MLFNIKKNEIKKKKILLLLFLFLIYEQCLFKFVYSFAVSRRSLVLNSLGDNNGAVSFLKNRNNQYIYYMNEHIYVYPFYLFFIGTC